MTTPLPPYLAESIQTAIRHSSSPSHSLLLLRLLRRYRADTGGAAKTTEDQSAEGQSAESQSAGTASKDAESAAIAPRMTDADVARLQNQIRAAAVLGLTLR